MVKQATTRKPKWAGEGGPQKITINLPDELAADLYERFGTKKASLARVALYLLRDQENGNYWGYGLECALERELSPVARALESLKGVEDQGAVRDALMKEYGLSDHPMELVLGARRGAEAEETTVETEGE